MKTNKDIRTIITETVETIRADFSNVEITRNGVEIIFHVASKAGLVDAKKAKNAAQEALKSLAPGRKLYHAKHNGGRVWVTYMGTDALAPVDGYAVGIRIEITEDEIKARVLGMWA